MSSGGSDMFSILLVAKQVFYRLSIYKSKHFCDNTYVINLTNLNRYEKKVVRHSTLGIVDY